MRLKSCVGVANVTPPPAQLKMDGTYFGRHWDVQSHPKGIVFGFQYSTFSVSVLGSPSDFKVGGSNLSFLRRGGGDC